MFKPIAFTLSVASAVLAQSSSSPLIPSGVSDSCNKFLQAFNQDASVKSAIAPVLSVVAPYLPGGSSSTPSQAQIVSSLNTLCASGASPDAVVQPKLADFYSACSAELTSSPNKDVVNMYDVLYVIPPLIKALCSKNDNGDYCVSKAKLPGSSSAAASGLSNNIANAGPAPEDIQKYLFSERTLARRAPTAALVPNTTTYANSNLPFLFLQPTDSTEALCTPCTRNTLTAYINFESAVPYGPGLASSPILKNQPALYNAISEKCGSSFLGGAVQAAGGLKGGILGNGAPRALGAENALTFIAVALGATAVTFSVL